jgi:hypothetical protein
VVEPTVETGTFMSLEPDLENLYVLANFDNGKFI